MKNRNVSTRRNHAFAHLPLAAAIHLACFSLAFADADPQATGGASSDQKTTELETLTVTAQKVEENPQNVPISLDVLTTDKLTEMNVSDISDWVKLLPSVSTSSSQGAYQPGFGQVSMRGVESGSNGNHSGPSPSVGIYLDEEPITTIVGSIDPHIYDIARIEALAGPQGTLYGASSEAGTLRIITNKPDPSAFSASVSVEGNTIDHGGSGYIAEGYVNVPITSWMALRAVGWSKQDAGYIDNVFGTRTYPTSGITIDNGRFARKDYNFADTRGARAALKIDLNENWSITPSVVGQGAHVNGIYAFDPHVGDLKVTHFFPEDSEDRWIQSALTVHGKIGNFDVVYAAAHLNRSDHYDQDYSDYSYWYDVKAGYGAYIHDNNGNLIDPSQHIHANDVYRKTSNELRVSSPRDQRFRFTVGAFAEVQSHDILQDYLINNLGSDLSVTGWPNTIWLTRQVRNDNDSAVFGEMSYDITDQLTGTVGARFFHTEDSLKGFFGFSAGYSSSEGEATCINQIPFEGAPCTEFNKEIKESDHIVRGNLTYKLDDDKMLYATYSEGFRPGGINRRGTLPPYLADFLDNYELGWKTEWLDHRLRWNGSIFEDKWKDFQFAVVGANGLTEIRNANQARIRGFESNLAWAATYNLVISGGVAVYNAALTQNYCGVLDANDNPITDCAAPLAPKGARLPITPHVKGDITARYNFNIDGHESYVQAAAFGTGRRRSDLRTAENNILGDLPGYGTVDLSAGMTFTPWSLDFYLKNAFDNRGQIARYAECQVQICGDQTYIIPVQPRTIGIRVTRDF
ncbi:MAG TPA: TonB-dependent receptor [Rudaea sp.]|nr:TonB-dependent receptor [Rudaea sp.]